MVEKADGPLQVGRADGVNCRTVEMFEAFGLAEKMIDEAYWVNETHFWGADPQDNARITRLGRTQDVRDLLSEFPHVIVNQARLLDFFLEHMSHSPSRLKVDYGLEALKADVPDGRRRTGHRHPAPRRRRTGTRSPSAPSTSSAATARTA